MKTITVAQLIKELSSYNPNLPVWIQIGDDEFNISDVFLSANADGSNGKITIEHWKKAEDENESGVFI